METFLDRAVKWAKVRPVITEIQSDFTRCMRVAAFDNRWLLETEHLDTEGVSCIETLLTCDKVTAVLLDREYFERDGSSCNRLDLKDPRNDDYPIGSRVRLQPKAHYDPSLHPDSVSEF